MLRVCCKRSERFALAIEPVRATEGMSRLSIFNNLEEVVMDIGSVL
jgi:hypothetical protein